MKITAGEVYDAYQALQVLAKEKLPVKGAYWLGRLVRKLEPEYHAVETQRNELVKKHGKDKDGQIQVSGAAIPAFSAEFSQVLSSEIEIDCPMLKLELLGDGAISGGLLIPLQRFISEE